MLSEENSKLISELYNAKNEHDIYDILEYMGESGDSIFVYPILDGYRKYKLSSIGYYFIWELSRLDYPNLGKRLDGLLESYEIQKEHIPMALFFMAERNYSSNTANRIVAMYLDSCVDPEFRKDFNLNGVGLACVLHYLERVELVPRYEDRLRELIFSGDMTRVEKAVVLVILLSSYPEKQIDFFISRYDEMRGTDLEKILAREIILCKAENVKKMKKLIQEKGGDGAKGVLKNLGKKVGAFQSDAPENVVYKNTDAIIKIGILRAQINGKTAGSEEFGFKVFPESDLLINQAHSIDDRDIFFSLCEDLLGLIRTVDPAVRNHGYGPEEAQQIWVDVEKEKQEMSLVNLLLFLDSRKIGVDYNFYGFRQLDKALESIAEHKEDDEFYAKLRRLGVEQLYREKKWHNIHSFFLNYYMQVLENMNKELNHLTKCN